MKRSFDIVVSALALVVLSPLLLLTFLLVRAKLGAPSLFRQPRPGLHGRIFILFKFRSMADLPGAGRGGQSDEQRLSSFGRWLRSTSLDELPELVNVLRGEMSLVGPRPLLVEYLPRYTTDEARRHLVRPGLTGLAQILGRNRLSWRTRLRLDVWYVENQSFCLDLHIIARTFGQVLRRQGISPAGAATMPEFRPERKVWES